jgi:hypothetical protein
VTAGNRFDRIHSIDPRRARGVSKEAASCFPNWPDRRERPTGRNSIDVGNRSARKPSQLHTRHPRRSHTQKRPLAAPRSWGSDERARASLLFPLTDGERDTHTHTHTPTQSFSQPRVCFNAKSLRQIKMIIKGVEC